MIKVKNMPHIGSRLILTSLSLSLALTLLTGGLTHALSGSEFKAGRIIDDTLFYNGTTMSPEEVQNFLNTKVPTCDTWGTQPYGGTTRAEYGTSRGYPPPYTCLKEYRQDTGYRAGESGLCSAIEAKSNRTAAQIIDDVARACHISQKAIIVMLQKEQGLVTDDWPWDIQYRSAMGYGCPDTAACDSEYYGFFNQVYNAARQFQRYKADPYNWNHVPFMTNNVLYQANAPSCGSRSTYIENYATAGLYNYTPYTPNQAALDNLYGTGDSCSAYGNRNFWRYYNDWFGTPLGPDYQATFFKQSEYQTLTSGSPKTIYFMFKNTGRLAWGDNVSAAGYNPIRLATDNPINRSSVFADSSWLSPNRTSGTFSAVYEADGITLAPDQHVVNPGQVVKMSFTISATPGVAPGFYPEHFILMREGASDWAIQGSSVWTGVTVSPTHIASYHAQSEYPSLKTNEKINAWVAYKNTGNVAWYDDISVPPGQNPVHLATANELNRKSRFGSSWPSSNRPSGTFSAVYESDGVTPAADQHVVNPGQIAKFEFTLTVPIFVGSGSYREYFQPILEGSNRWDMGGDVWLNVSVTNAARTAAYHSQSNYPVIKKGSSAPIHFLLKNSGQTKWYDDTSARTGIYPTHLASTEPINRTSVFSTPGQWLSSNRPSGTFSAVYESDGVTPAADQHVVNPGQIAKFEFTMTVPVGTSNGFFQEYFQPIFEGGPNGTWNMDGKVWIGVTVEN